MIWIFSFLGHIGKQDKHHVEFIASYKGDYDNSLYLYRLIKQRAFQSSTPSMHYICISTIWFALELQTSVHINFFYVSIIMSHQESDFFEFIY
jgi:hypothetical protein